ncbi:MAG: VOC family protein [Bacteroidota bacterium]
MSLIPHYDRLDHLAYVVPDLPTAIQAIEDALGVSPQPGGRHPRRGTYNALLRIGERCYLELLAVDPATEVAPPRWMGVDAVDRARLTRWALRSDQLAVDAQRLATLQPALGQIQAGHRRMADGQELHWQLTIPRSHPAVELLPFFIDWQQSPHPSTSLPPACQLERLDFFHPQSTHISKQWHQLGLSTPVAAAERVRIRATLRSSRGSLVLE